MSSFVEASWVRRLISRGKPGEPVAPYVSNVQLVNDDSVRGSRERAPYGRIINASAAPAAGEFAGWELRADDVMSTPPLVYLHGLRAFAAGPAVIIGMVQTPTAALIADRTAAAFTFRDRDEDISLSCFQLSTAGGDLPGTPFTMAPDIGVTAGWVGIFPYPKLPFAGHWQDGESLYVWAFAANVAVSIDATIQGVRA